jgi:dynein heavy chain
MRHHGMMRHAASLLPAGVKCVLEAVCVLMGDKPTRVKDPKSGKFEDSYTTPIKKMLADRDFTSHV